MRKLLLGSLLLWNCSAPPAPAPLSQTASATPQALQLEIPAEALAIDKQISHDILKSKGMGGSVMVWSGPDGVRRIDRDAGDTYRFYYTNGTLKAAYGSGRWGPIVSKGGALQAPVERWATYNPSAPALQLIHVFEEIQPLPDASVREMEKLGNALYKQHAR